MTLTSKIASALLAAGLAGLACLPAQAEDGMWKAGDSYAIRFEQLDLNQPADRQILLGQVNRAAGKACAGVHTKARKEACMKDVTARALNGVSPHIRAAVTTARLERDGLRQAQR